MQRTVSCRRMALAVLWAGLVAWPTAGKAQIAAQCDSIHGSGWFNTTANETHPLARVRFTLTGGCKDGSPTWGSLDYTDEGNGLQVTWTSITAYIWDGNDGPDLQTGRPLGARILCGKATTNLFADVDFGVVVYDGGEPGANDVFVIRLRKDGHTVYSTENPQQDLTLGGTSNGGGNGGGNGGSNGGGNIQFSERTPGSFGGSCPAFF